MATQTLYLRRLHNLRERQGLVFTLFLVACLPLLFAARWCAPLLHLREDQFVPSRVIKTVEWTGSLFGLAGAYLLAMNTPFSAYAFVLYLLSNACWLWYGLKTRAWGLATMQVGFTVSSILGISNWL